MADDKVELAMEKVEEFFFDDNEETGGEAIFNKFAAKHGSLFDEGCDAKSTENKLE